MFEVNNITSPIPGRYACRCVTQSERDAENIVARFLMSVRMRGVGAELYNKGKVVFVDTPCYEVTAELAELLNNSI